MTEPTSQREWDYTFHVQDNTVDSVREFAGVTRQPSYNDVVALGDNLARIWGGHVIASEIRERGPGTQLIPYTPPGVANAAQPVTIVDTGELSSPDVLPAYVPALVYPIEYEETSTND